MNAQDLVSRLGDPLLLRTLSTMATDTSDSSSNALWLTEVPVLGYDGVLFIEICGATDATDLHQIQICYTSLSTGTEGSDAASSAAGWTCSDALMTVGPRAAVGNINMLDFRFGQKEMSGGFLHGSIVGTAETGAATAALIAIPYGGTRLIPATNAITAVIADDKSP